jgi:hypothetical protein
MDSNTTTGSSTSDDRVHEDRTLFIGHLAEAVMTKIYPTCQRVWRG